MAERQSLPVTITLSPKLFRLAERIAKEEGRTRSELFREALRKYIWERNWQKLQQYGHLQAKQLGIREADIEALIDQRRS